MFDAINDDELAGHQAAITAGALHTARTIASDYLARSLPTRLDLTPIRITEVLLGRDSADPDFGLLAPYEKRWATLVIRLVGPVMRPDLAVHDAVLRGVSWGEIAGALGVARTTAYRNFAKQDM